LAEDDEGGCEEEVEIDDRLEFLGAAPELAVAIHPLVRSFHDPARAGLDRGRDPLASAGAVEAECREQGPCCTAVLAAIEMHRQILGQAVEFVQAGECWLKQGAIVAVGAGRDQMQGDAGCLGHDRALEPLLAAIHW